MPCSAAAGNNLLPHDTLTAVNRAYYAVFHAMCAVLARDRIVRRHHSGIISEFRKLYIRTGLFDVYHSDSINLLFDLRSESDYDIECEISEEEAVEMIDRAERFTRDVEVFLASR